MTQTLDIHQDVSRLNRAQAASSPAAPAAISKSGIFAITFGITFAVLYTVLEQLNWPLFTYHPAVGKLDFWMQRPRSGEGPPMYWYGWLALSFPAAALVGWIATLVSTQWVLRATIFCCVLAALWPAAFGIAVFMDERTSFDTDLVKTLMWMSAIPGLVGAAVASYFIPVQWTERMWTKLLLIV